MYVAQAMMNVAICIRPQTTSHFTSLLFVGILTNLNLLNTISCTIVAAE